MQVNRVARRGRKYTGSPLMFQKKTMDFYIKKGKMASDDISLFGNIIHGWLFDCCCGVRGANYDDNYSMIQCDVCELWMHCYCNNVPTSKAGHWKKFFQKFIWICANCKDGDYKYRGSFWKNSETQWAQTITFKEGSEERGDHPFCIPPHNPEAKPKSSILRKSKTYDDVELPTPTSPP